MWVFFSGVLTKFNSWLPRAQSPDLLSSICQCAWWKCFPGLISSPQNNVIEPVALGDAVQYHYYVLFPS